jgi:Zn-dependent M32 family carboxypeptidase
MKTLSLIVAASALAFAGTAFAQEAGSDTWMNAASSKSRAEVQAELQQARASGITKSWSAGYMDKLVSSQSREQVAAAVRSARASGELDRINAEAFQHDRNPPPAKADTRLAQSQR